MLSVHNPGDQVHHILSQSSNFGSGYATQHVQNLQPLEHNLLFWYQHRELLVLILRQVPPVLGLRRLLFEEDRNAAGEDAVERGPPGRSIAGRLQAEARLQHRLHEPNWVVLAYPIRAILDLAQLRVPTIEAVPNVAGAVVAGAVVTFVSDATPYVGCGGDPSAANKEHQSVALGPPNPLQPRLQEREVRRVERRRVRDRMLLPRPGPRLHRQSGDVEELRQFQKRGAPHGRVIAQRLREIPGGSGQDQEVVVTHVPVPHAGFVVLQEIVQFEAVLGAGVVVRTVEVSQGVDGRVVREVDGVGGIGIWSQTLVFEHPTVENEFEH